MNPRLALLPVAAALMLGLSGPAYAATFLGSSETDTTPDGYACAQCPPGTSVGVRQFALRGATVEAPEDGVIVSASVNAKRIAPGATPRLALLRPAGDIGVTVAASAPLPATGDVGDLHLAMRQGDSLGFLFTAGQVDLGVRSRPRPDGAIQTFAPPCDPCGMDGGTGTELLLGAVLEPDVDQDGLGDESQDPDGGGLGMDWEDDWFDDYADGDELDEDPFDEAVPVRRRPLQLLSVQRRRGRGAVARLRVPRPGRVRVAVTLPSVRRTGAGPFLTVLVGDMRARRAGRVRVRLTPTPAGARVLAHHGRLRTKVVASLQPRGGGSIAVVMRSATVARP
jgi:hypothetical protein